MGACCGNNKEYQMATKFYSRACHVERFGRPKRVRKWDNTLCIVCGKTLLDKEMWNDIPGRGETCNMAIAKIEDVSSEEIRTIKNNLPEPIELDWDAKPVINFLEPEKFHEHYQNLAPTKEKQEQWLA
ncbi:hypothetical protein G9A89_013403 [Geosiphon pyriformis]|nr:hypothetical protein G9A89_013403 [Geosiphon pyriformis]